MKKKSHKTRIDGPYKMGHVSWDYFFQLNEDQSLYLIKDEPTDFIFKTSSEKEIDKLFLHTNGFDNQWEFIPVSKIGFNQFSSSLKFTTCGLFHFKLIYQFKNDEYYYWDHQPYTKLSIESQSFHNISVYTYIPNISGKISDWAKDFVKISSLGFNAVHLLPITELDDSQSPYAAKELFHVDPYYFDLNKKNPEKHFIETLVEASQTNSIKLCLDLVFNHVGVNSNLVKKNPHWIHPDPTEIDGLKRAGYWHDNQWLKWRDIVLINFDHPVEEIKEEIWDYFIKYSLFWSEIANRTNGLIRLDNLHSTNFLFAEKALAEIRKNFPDLIIQAELFADDYAISKYMAKGNINLLLSTPWMAPYARDFRNQIKNIHHLYEIKRYIFAVSSHDSDSAVEMYGSKEAIIPRYTATSLMSTGCTGMIQGTENGIPKKLRFIGYQPKLEIPEDLNLQKAITKINKIKNSYKTFQTGKNIEFIDNENSAILACIRYGKKYKEPDFIIITNFNTSGYQSLSLNLTNYHSHLAKNLLTGAVIPLANIKDTTLAPSETIILEIQPK